MQSDDVVDDRAAYLVEAHDVADVANPVLHRAKVLPLEGCSDAAAVVVAAHCTHTERYEAVQHHAGCDRRVHVTTRCEAEQQKPGAADAPMTCCTFRCSTANWRHDSALRSVFTTRFATAHHATTRRHPTPL
jgi:hypothetical protein